MKNKETNIVEYKETINDGDEKYAFEIAVESFLNSQNGGTLYIGIKNNGEVVGIENTDSIQLKIKDRIKTNISPSTIGLYDVSIEEREGKDVIKIVISSGKEKPYYVKKKGMSPEGCHIRVGSSREQMTTRMIEDLFSRRVRNSMKEIPSPTQELTFKQLKIYYEDNHKKITNNLLKNLNLYTSNGEYNYYAYLLADENQVPIPVVKYAGITKKEIIENEDYGNRCILTATYRILDKLEAENRTFTKLEVKGRKHITMFDMEVMKEIITNAMCHNDYSYNGTPIVDIYSDRIEVTSTGGLPAQLSKREFLKGVVYRRNPELLKVFQDVDLIENVGSGVKRILESYDKSCFDFMEHFLRVSIKFKENPFEYQEQTIKKPLRNHKETIKKPLRNISSKEIIEYCKTPRKLKEICNNFGFKDIQSFKKNHINPLLESNKLFMTIPGQPKNRNQMYKSKIN